MSVTEFYLQSRGIPYEETMKLLINGFLVSNLPDRKKDDLKDIINYYWSNSRWTYGKEMEK